MRIEHPILIGASSKGLELSEDLDNQVNKHWTMGPKGFAKAHIKEEMDNPANMWKVASPEFREDKPVNNPLFITDGHPQANGDQHRKYSKKKKKDHSESKDQKLLNTKL